MNRFIGFKAVSIVGIFVLLLTVNIAQADSAQTLSAPDGTKGARHNAEGIKLYNEGNWNDAKMHFGEAEKKNAEDKTSSSLF